jgi:hypothetical protein
MDTVKGVNNVNTSQKITSSLAARSTVVVVTYVERIICFMWVQF